VTCGFSSGSRDQLCSPPAILFGVDFLLCRFTGGLFLCLTPFLLARSVICQPDPCCQHIVMVCWLFFNFAVLFDFGCCSLAQEMSFVDRYLLYFRQWLTTCLVSALLPFQPFVCWKFAWRSAPCSSPFSSVLTAPRPLCYVLVLVPCFFLFCLQGREVSLHRPLCWFITGVAGEMLHDAWCSPVGLLNVSQAGLEPASGDTGALLFSQCSMVWRSFIWARGSVC
jgi:hypothetical protein